VNILQPLFSLNSYVTFQFAMLTECGRRT